MGWDTTQRLLLLSRAVASGLSSPPISREPQDPNSGPRGF